MLKGVAAERSPGSCRKERIIHLTGALPQPATQHRDDGRRERRDPLLPSFAEAADMRTDAKMDVRLPECDQFRDAQPRLDCESEERVVASTGPRGVSGRRQKRVDFRFSEEGHEPALEAFGRNREHACDDRGMLGMPKRRETKQRANRGEPGIPRPNAVPLIMFTVIEKGTDHRGIEIVDRQL
jgi:hypothetical protein